MTRAKETDLFQNHTFQVIDSRGLVDRVSAGFSTASIPDQSISVAEYRESMRDKFPRKYPGLPESLPDITLERGLAAANTGFLDWLRAAYEGGEYRTDIQILHYHKPGDDSPAIIYQLFEAFPILVGPASDLDSDDSEISIVQLDIAAEEMKRVRKSIPDPAFDPEDIEL